MPKLRHNDISGLHTRTWYTDMRTPQLLAFVVVVDWLGEQLGVTAENVNSASYREGSRLRARRDRHSKKDLRKIAIRERNPVGDKRRGSCTEAVRREQKFTAFKPAIRKPTFIPQRRIGTVDMGWSKFILSVLWLLSAATHAFSAGIQAGSVYGVHPSRSDFFHSLSLLCECSRNREGLAIHQCDTLTIVWRGGESSWSEDDTNSCTFGGELSSTCGDNGAVDTDLQKEISLWSSTQRGATLAMALATALVKHLHGPDVSLCCSKIGNNVHAAPRGIGPEDSQDTTTEGFAPRLLPLPTSFPARRVSFAFRHIGLQREERTMQAGKGRRRADRW
ncbi:hypothetical protein C8R45DRAFT_1133359 [Mycena sanguinolenta]|nr:hypothetical protein C8R45DRAFT_1133359 [Mycena sanguinolenta]